ncbi:MAG: SRPBCC domain-containing protein [Promethearchaeota archaeon]|nr:MAG: SRPBCC domain-containing protein [Candidatus Lokiarchaeota archaeon]
MENIVLIKEVIDCSIDVAFRCFTINELLENWLTEKADINPKKGGKYELFWDLKNKEINSTLGCKITGIEKNKYISFDWKGPIDFQSFMNFADPLTHVIVFFSNNNKDPNMTIIHLFHTGWRNDTDWQKARDYFENAWSKALRNLKEKLENKLLV